MPHTISPYTNFDVQPKGLPIGAEMRKLLRARPITCRSFSSQTTKLQKLSLAYQRHESPSSPSAGPPIILMHGLFGSQRNNRTMSKVLAKDLSRDVYAIDLRNHGDSPHDLRHDYTAMSEDIENFINEHSLKRPILMGHSMGAKVAMTLALRSPTSYSGLVPVDNAPIDAALKSDFGTYVKAMREIEEKNTTSFVSKKSFKQSDADAILQKYEPDLSIRQFLLTNFVRNPDKSGPQYHFRIPLQTLAKSLPAMADFPFRDPDETRFEGPTLVVRGTRSHYVADESLPLIGRYFPKFELLSLDSGHWAMAEKFEEFRKGAVDWMERCVEKW